MGSLQRLIHVIWIRTGSGWPSAKVILLESDTHACKAGKTPLLSQDGSPVGLETFQPCCRSCQKVGKEILSVFGPKTVRKLAVFRSVIDQIYAESLGVFPWREVAWDWRMTKDWIHFLVCFLDQRRLTCKIVPAGQEDVFYTASF